MLADANVNVEFRERLERRGRLISVLLEIGSDLNPEVAHLRTPLIVRRLRMYGEGAELPREDPGGSTSLLIQLHQGLIPAVEKQIDQVIAIGELAHFPLATQPALAMMQELARTLVVPDYFPFAIEPAWARTLGQMVQDVTGVAPPASVVAAARRAQIERMVERFSSDPRLSSDTIAATLQISRRTLYDLTSSALGGISEHIRATRARRAATMLADPELAHLSLTDVALRTGLSSEKQVRRALQSVYGATPADVRAGRLSLAEMQCVAYRAAPSSEPVT